MNTNKWGDFQIRISVPLIVWNYSEESSIYKLTNARVTTHTDGILHNLGRHLWDPLQYTYHEFSS